MAPPDGFRLDTSRWPLAIVHSPKRPVTEAEIDTFFAEQRAMLARGERYVEVAITSEMHMLPANQRKRFAEFLRDTDARGTQLCVGLAIVIPSAILRGGMTAIFWIFKPAYPIKAVSSMAEAAAFLLESAAAAGLPLSTAARSYLEVESARPSA